MKKIYFLLGLAWLLCSLSGQALAQQAPASANWALTDPAVAGGTGLAVNTSGQVTSANALLKSLEINGYTGTDASQRLRITGNLWPTNQTDTIAGVYVQYKVSPTDGHNLTVNSVAFKIGAHSSSNMVAKAFYSTDPSFKTATPIEFTTGAANNVLSTSVLKEVSLSSLNVAVGNGETFYVRIYPWLHNQTSSLSGKYVTLKDVVISGQTSPVVTTASYSLAVTTVGQGAVSPAEGTFTAGEEVTLTATPAQGWVFSGWSGDATGTTNPLTITMGANKAITATFTQAPATTFTLAVTTVGQGSVSPNEGNYNEGEEVTLTATPASGWEFSGWSGDATGSANPLSLSMTANKAVTATFTELPPATSMTASTIWALTSETAGTVATSGQVQGSSERFRNMEINQYTGPESSQRIRIAGNAWPAAQTDTLTGTYTQFAITPNPNNKLVVKGISYKIGSTGTGAMKTKVFYSTDPSFKTATLIENGSGAAENAMLRDALAPVSADLNVTVEEGDSLYLRFYPWVHDQGAVATGKYIALKDVVIFGETESLPVASSIVWNSDETFSVTGALMGQAPSYSAAMKYYTSQQPSLPTTDTNQEVVTAAIQTVSQDWQAEPNPVESLWFQYGVSPKTGATFTVKNVKMHIGGWFTSNLKATIYYSKDPTFSTKTVLFEDRPLVGNKVEPISADVNVVVNSGETFYVRIYPHNTKAEGWAKLVAIYNMTISGEAVGVTVDPATVTTGTVVSRISTTSATAGGNISSDGGSPVTARGLVYGTAENPTVDGSKTTSGEGSGTFSSEITGLTPNTTYFVRAYATNAAGTAYGEQVSFKTLAELTVPTVTTAAISTILTKTAQGGGSVTEWGGTEVTARGIVWGTTTEPTLADSKSEDGAGLGSFTSLLHSLTANTTYYVRAYATNSQGTGYGPEVTFTTQAQAPDVTKVVAKDGTGDYTTVQAAFNAVPDFYTGKYTILVKPGTYYEKVILERNKVNVILRGEDPNTTIITYDDYAGKNNLGTSGSYTAAIEPDDFIAVNVTFQNTVQNDGSVANQQAVALRTNGDRQAYYNCRILGYQDTYYAWGGRTVGRVYMKDCFIEGSVDFIFGRQVVVFDNCTLKVNRHGGVITAASTEANTKHGFVFLNSTVTTPEVGFDGNAITSFLLGRPWQAAPRTVFMNSVLPANLSPAGWGTWNVTPALYGEYNNSGPGASLTGRSSISRALTEAEAGEHTIANIFAKETHPSYSFDWMPEPVQYTVTGVRADVNNPVFSLGQNYPNPYKGVTTIQYELKKAGAVTIEVFDATGKRVMTLQNGLKTTGTHEVQLNQTLKGGLYYYRLSSGGMQATRRMIVTQ